MDKIWLHKLEEYTNNGKVGNCPVCGSCNFKAEVFNSGRISITFFCEDCGVNRHLDGSAQC